MAATPVGPGTLLAGRFLLEDLLDEFDGARFWRATDKILARNVAVHVIPADDPRSEALLNAARTSATVSDGHLLRVLDAATEDGVTYVVNEWGHGVSLDRLLAEGPLSSRRAAWVAQEVAEAISAAHKHGIAHGRLLPESVIVTEAGSIKLVGFVVDAVIRGRESVRVTGGRPLAEHEADVVNLAAILYAGLVGRWPGTEGSTVADAPTEHGRPLRPRRVRAGVPRPLDAICERVLNPDANGHSTPLETAHEIYAALCDFVGDPSGAALVGMEPTAFFDQAELAHLRGEPVEPHDGATEHESGDPDLNDATQAGAPVFKDDDTAVGWTPGTGTQDPEATELSAAVDAPRQQPYEPPVMPPPPEPRPLFASDAPRRTRPPAQQRSTGAGNGPLPPGWGPTDDDTATGASTDADAAAWDDDPPGRNWMRLGLWLGGALLLLVAIVIAFNLGRGSGPDESPASPPADEGGAPAEPVQISGVTDFDPLADPPSENPESAPLAIDGNPTTAWRTSTYYDPLPLLKDGVGLLVDLGEPTEISEVTLTFIGSPTSFEILAAEDGANAPTSEQELRRVAQQERAGTKANVPLQETVTTQYVVVWLTDLPRASGGFRGQVAEIVVR